ncbi:hypothetical protein HN018_23230 (plasmid) [Lichenicola cladoniae]|uniref:Uncharacterized protein n=1 Tax=Lichenicola cladoniae TaxID=1484109 RepID=A0A6M8HX13_9PROT|nr:hypothetical protein [Lichenicola cladoniae]NPD66368.1 hypothetical protein [Acetobacteraceae bacterium]QKE93104.1 hypothetical protein HN018_23230 [Lichenicola cladoniae]
MGWLWPRRITLETDKGYNVTSFVHALRQRRMTPHITSRRRVSNLRDKRRKS